MKTRIISGIAMLPLLGILYLRGYYIDAFVFFVALVGEFELYRAFKIKGIKPSTIIGFISTIGLLAYITFTKEGVNPTYIFLWLFLTLLFSLLTLFDIENKDIEDALVTFLGPLYIGFFVSHFILLDNSFKEPMIWLVPIAAFGTDVFAYFVGVTIGKHRLCPKISPKKSIEGAIGGVLGSGILCGIFSYFFINEYFYICLGSGLFASIFSQFGDLTASIFKRKIGIKDYGNLIPGHGGILDRFDSILFAAPGIYYFLIIALKLA